jgi:putative ABC transport system permease protein
LQNDIAINKNVERIGLVSTPFGGTSATCLIKKENTGENSIANYYAANADFITNMNLNFVAGKNSTRKYKRFCFKFCCGK